MSLGVFISGADPDTSYKQLIKEVYHNGSLFGDTYVLPTTTIKSYANKRYLTITGVNLPDIYEAVFNLVYEPAELGDKVRDLFNAGRDIFLIEGRSVITWFGYAEVRNNTLNFTVINRSVDVVTEYSSMYTYYLLLMELVASVTGFRMGSITFFLNNATMLTKDCSVYEQLKGAQSYSYKMNPLITPSYKDLVNYVEYAIGLLNQYRENPKKDFDLSVVTDPGWREVLAVLMFNVKMGVQDYASAKCCVDLMDSFSYEWLWCVKRMEGLIQHGNTF